MTGEESVANVVSREVSDPAFWFEGEVRINLRSGLRPERANAEKLNIGRKVIALRGREPGDPLPLGAGQRGVEYAELDGLDIGGLRGDGGGGFEVGGGDLNVDSADAVGARVLGEGRDRIQPG